MLILHQSELPAIAVLHTATFEQINPSSAHRDKSNNSYFQYIKNAHWNSELKCPNRKLSL